MECVRCGRPLACEHDALRWYDETSFSIGGAAGLAFPPGFGADDIGQTKMSRVKVGDRVHIVPFDAPAWSAALCWSRAQEEPVQCHRRRQWASDRWISRARLSFDLHVKAFAHP